MNDDEARSWCERVATHFAHHGGLPPIAGRTLGWLMICESPEQSAAEIATGIGASRASLTTMLRLLQTAGLIEPVTRAGGRTTYYRIVDDAWARVLRARFAGLTGFLDIARDGMDLVGPGSARAGRVRAAHELYQWLADEVGPLWERWDART